MIDDIITGYKLTEEFIEHFANILDKLSEEFIEKFQDKVWWYYMRRHQTLSEEFNQKHRDKLC